MTGDVVRFGTLYQGDSPVLVPMNPVTESDGGDILRYDLVNMPEVTIKDTTTDDRYTMRWVEVYDEDESTTIYIADRNMLAYFSWNDMNDYMKMVEGKTVTIDGKRYTLRSIYGGQTNFEGETNALSYNGGAEPNEWDNFICNRLGLAGLPTPAIGTGEDSKGHTLSQPGSGETEQDSEHNRLWHWYRMGTRCADQPNDDGYVPRRGYSAAAYWYNLSTDHGSSPYGALRPVLILQNSNPPAPVIDGPHYGERASGDITLLFSPQPDPDRDNSTLSVEISSSAAFAADATKIFTSGIQKKGSNGSWSNSTSYTKSDVGAQYRYVIPASQFSEWPEVYIRVGARDAGTYETVYSQPVLVRVGGTIDIKGKSPSSRTEMPTNCVLYVTAQIAPGATAHYYACNNGLDASPTWEEVTPSEVHTFTNTAKTADAWALNWRITVDAGTATGEIKIGPQVALGVV